LVSVRDVVRGLLVIAAVLLIAGCANHSPEAEAQAQADAGVADVAKCQAAGLQPNTPAFERCLTQLADQRAAADYADRAALAARLQGRLPGTF
jgi:hypothetical protein